MPSLEGKVAIVTGAGRVIGRGHALALADAGARVVVNDLGATLAGEGTDATPAHWAWTVDTVPPAASMSLYLNSSCRGQNSVLTAYSGNVIFNQIFSGNLNEENATNRVTQGTFNVLVVDPHDAVPRDSSDGGPAYEFPKERSSEITGGFSFVFHRGTPAQPFPWAKARPSAPFVIPSVARDLPRRGAVTPLSGDPSPRSG